MLPLQSGLYRTMTGEAGPGCTVPWLSNRSAICEEEEDRVEAFRLEILKINIDTSGFPLEYSCHHSRTFFDYCTLRESRTFLTVLMLELWNSA